MHIRISLSAWVILCLGCCKNNEQANGEITIKNYIKNISEFGEGQQRGFIYLYFIVVMLLSMYACFKYPKNKQKLFQIC